MLVAAALLTYSWPGITAGAAAPDPSGHDPAEPDALVRAESVHPPGAPSPAPCDDAAGGRICLQRVSTSVPAAALVASAVEPATSAAAVDGQTVGAAQVCNGNGTDGYRVQAVYAYTGATADPASVSRIASAIVGVDTTFTTSAARTGGIRKVRWTTDSGSSGCQIVLRTAHIATGAADFDALMAELEGLGAVQSAGVGRVKYLVFTEGQIDPSQSSVCGLGEFYNDDGPLGVGTNFNLLSTRAAVDTRCWDLTEEGSIPAHELMHTLGAVQDSAPHAGNDGHCTDEYDLMCYGAGLTYPCPSTSDNAVFDCGNDDYFNTDPINGQYLCDHWNTADSAYLEGWNVAQPPPR